MKRQGPKESPLAEVAQDLEQLEHAARWPAAVALLFVGVVYLVLPQRLRVGPSWLVLVAEVALLVPLIVTRLRGAHERSHQIALTLTALVTLALAVSAVFLVTRLPGSKSSGTDLLRETGLLWAVNVVVFAVWYWQIDGGGPLRRRLGHYVSDDFLFPQFQQDPAGPPQPWMPDFVDYLFLAFNTSTAFSPTDTLILSRRAKLLLMTQSLISLVVIAVLAARAINTL